MMKSEENPAWHKFRDAMSKSAILLRDNKYQEALRVVDEAIADAMQNSEARWVLTLSHHAAAISRLVGNQELVKKYYEQSLAFVPENPRALYGLASVAREAGEIEVARQYAARCYRAVAERDKDDVLVKSLRESVIERWPEVAVSTPK